MVNITLRTEPNSPLAYAPVLELHRPIMSTLGAHGGQLERERDIYVVIIYIFVSYIPYRFMIYILNNIHNIYMVY